MPNNEQLTQLETRINALEQEMQGQLQAFTSTEGGDGAATLAADELQILQNLEQEAAELFQEYDRLVAEDNNNQGPFYNFTYRGTAYSMTEADYEEFKDETIRSVRSSIMPELVGKVRSAQDLYEHFVRQNQDQSVVSFLLSVTGTRLPNFSVIEVALDAINTINSALRNRDFRGIEQGLTNGQRVINNTLDTMRQYREETINVAGRWVTGLEITRTTCFMIVSAVAGGGPAASIGRQIGVSVAAALIEETAREVGEFAVGDTEIDWGRIASSLALGLGGGLAGRFAQPLAGNIIGRLGLPTELLSTQALTSILGGSIENGLNQTFREVINTLGGEPLTLGGFLGRVSGALFTGALAGTFKEAISASMTATISPRLSAFMANRIPSGFFSTHGIDASAFTRELTNAISGSGGAAVGSAVSYVLSTIIASAAGDSNASLSVDGLLGRVVPQMIARGFSSSLLGQIPSDNTALMIREFDAAMSN